MAPSSDVIAQIHLLLDYTGGLEIRNANHSGRLGYHVYVTTASTNGNPVTGNTITDVITHGESPLLNATTTELNPPEGFGGEDGASYSLPLLTASPRP